MRRGRKLCQRAVPAGNVLLHVRMHTDGGRRRGSSAICRTATHLSTTHSDSRHWRSTEPSSWSKTRTAPCVHTKHRRGVSANASCRTSAAAVVLCFFHVRIGNIVRTGRKLCQRAVREGNVLFSVYMHTEGGRRRGRSATGHDGQCRRHEG